MKFLLLFTLLCSSFLSAMVVAPPKIVNKSPQTINDEEEVYTPLQEPYKKYWEAEEESPEE